MQTETIGDPSPEYKVKDMQTQPLGDQQNARNATFRDVYNRKSYSMDLFSKNTYLETTSLSKSL